MIQGTAAELFVSFMNEGHYPRLSQLKKEKKEIHKQVQRCFQDREEKRFVYEKQGMVGKFTKKGVYHTDYLALNEYLLNKGLLPFLVEIDSAKVKNSLYWEEELKDFKQEPSYFVSSYFNKKGKALNAKNAVSNLTELSPEQLISIYSQTKAELEPLVSTYEQLKQEMKNCLELQKKVKVMHEYGSLKLNENPQTYDNHAIFHELGSEVLIEFGKPNPKKLEKFMEKGLISKKEMDTFKTLVDYRLDFMLMTLEAEKSMFNHFHERNLRMSMEQQKRA